MGCYSSKKNNSTEKKNAGLTVKTLTGHTVSVSTLEIL